jgi:hypothetical protein
MSRSSRRRSRTPGRFANRAYIRSSTASFSNRETARNPGRCDEPISTAITESTVQWLLHRRMGAQQQMRWPPRGAHLMLKVRTATANGTLDRDYGGRRALGPLTISEVNTPRFYTVSLCSCHLQIGSKHLQQLQ